MLSHITAPSVLCRNCPIFIADRLMRMRKQSGVRQILKDFKERMPCVQWIHIHKTLSQIIVLCWIHWIKVQEDSEAWSSQSGNSGLWCNTLLVNYCIAYACLTKYNLLGALQRTYLNLIYLISYSFACLQSWSFSEHDFCKSYWAND